MAVLAAWLDAFFEQHKGARRLTLLWIIALVTWATLIVFTSLEQITAPVAAAYGSLVGLVTVVTGLYVNLRAQDDRSKRDAD